MIKINNTLEILFQYSELNFFTHTSPPTGATRLFSIKSTIREREKLQSIQQDTTVEREGPEHDYVFTLYFQFRRQTSFVLDPEERHKDFSSLSVSVFSLHFWLLNPIDFITRCKIWNKLLSDWNIYWLIKTENVWLS